MCLFVCLCVCGSGDNLRMCWKSYSCYVHCCLLVAYRWPQSDASNPVPLVLDGEMADTLFIRIFKKKKNVFMQLETGKPTSSRWSHVDIPMIFFSFLIVFQVWNYTTPFSICPFDPTLFYCAASCWTASYDKNCISRALQDNAKILYFW